MPVLPYTDEQAERWRTRGPEPVTLTRPGWERRESSTALPNERLTELRKDGSTISMIRWWDRPLHPGGPMAEASRRTVVVDGTEQALLTTSMFQGRPAQVQLLFLRGPGWSVRVVFEGCTPAQIDEACAAIRIVEPAQGA